MRIYDTIRKNINKAVFLSGKSRMQVAKDAGVSYPNLCRFINGKRDGLGIDVLLKLSGELKVPISFFFGEGNISFRRNKDAAVDIDRCRELFEKINCLKAVDKKRVLDVMSVLIDSYL